MKTSSPQAFPDDFWCVTGEDFSLDAFFKDGSLLEREYEQENEKDSSCLSQNPNLFDDNFSPGLAIPGDDVGGLELWTNLMVPETTRACPNTNAQKNRTGFYVRNRVEPVGKKRGRGGVAFIPLAVPVKPRSKRLRPAEIRAWKSPSNTETSSASTTSSPVSTLLFPPDMNSVSVFGKRKPATAFGEGVGVGSAFQRRCNHCQATKTPQWRAGPDGPKTLCNACGVRYKSGRLYPEYRPACSPTFSSEVHSNSHRKVLEMRRKKESTASPVGSSPTVESR